MIIQMMARRRPWIVRLWRRIRGKDKAYRLAMRVITADRMAGR
jgi:hypothetical protein